jgi:hypothetical protein
MRQTARPGRSIRGTGDCRPFPERDHETHLPVCPYARCVGRAAFHCRYWPCPGWDRQSRATAFDNRMFAGPLREKTYACFVRRYDASHLAQHPRLKVSAMKLMVTAENPPEEIPPIIHSGSASNTATGPANSTPATFATTSSPKTRATRSVTAAASIARAVASMWQ